MSVGQITFYFKLGSITVSLQGMTVRMRTLQHSWGWDPWLLMWSWMP